LFGPEIAEAGVDPISPANSAKLIKTNPDFFVPGKMLTYLIYVRGLKIIDSPKSTDRPRFSGAIVCNYQ
jgi:hypothetical protein